MQIKVTESLEFFSKKFDELERENKKKNEKIKENLTKKNKSLTSDIGELSNTPAEIACCCMGFTLHKK